MIWRELYVVLGAIARSTKRIAIGPGVTHPLVRHFTVTASAMATLNELAPGRVRLGIGVGSSGPATIGVRRTGARELERTAQAIRELLRGQPVEVDGTRLQLSYSNGQTVPIYVAGNSDYTLRAAGRVADASIFSGPLDALTSAVDMIRQGDAARSVPLVWMVPSSISDEADAAREAVKPVVARTALVWLTRCAKRCELAPEDEGPFERLRQEYDPYRHMTTAYNHLVEERWVDRFSLAGTPEQVLEGARKAHAAGAEHILMSLHGEDLAQQLRRFAGILQPIQAL